MNKKLLIIAIVSIVSAVLWKVNSKESEIDKLRAQHETFLKEHPFQEKMRLPKAERKANGLPPNAYFEQKYLNEINPATGKTHKENVFKLQEQLNVLRAGQRLPGEVGNEWVERGPDNVGGRTRALLFDPNDATNETVFAGGVSGGLWKNTKISDPNQKWELVGISENLAVTCIVADPNDSKVFYVGTGESYVNGDVNGNGVWKSTDGGNTWTHVFGDNTGASYLDTNAQVKVNSPASVAGDYSAAFTTAFGNSDTLPLTADLVLADDGAPDTSDACGDIVNEAAMNGKIAIVRRGSCNFSLKALKVQEAGAIAVIVVNNNNDNPFNMAAGSDGPSVTIPALMVSKANGEALITAMESGTVNTTLSIVNANATNALILPGVRHVNDIVVRDNGGTSEVYVAAAESGYTGQAALGGSDYGLYKSTNGADFNKIDVPKTTGGNEYEPNDIEIASDNSIYLSTTRSYVGGDGGGAIFKSTDGENFELKHTVPSGLRTEIATSPTNAGVLYVLAQINNSAGPVKIYKTTDDFATTVTELALPNDVDNGIPATDFTRGQSFYDLLLRVDPNNEDVVYVGGIDLFKSTNGGTSWNQISKWSNNNALAALNVPLVHADQHGLAFASSDRMVFGNDGGVYFSNNAGTGIDARNNNYNTLQFYTLGVAPTTAFAGATHVVAGAQDNGTQLLRNATAGINSSDRVFGGDGAASFFDTDGTDKYAVVNYVYNAAISAYFPETNAYVTINEENGSNGSFINQQDLDSNLNILYSNYSSSAGGNTIRRYSNILVNGGVVKESIFNPLMDASPSVLKVSPHTTASSKLFVGLSNGKLLKVEEANTGTGTWTEITGDSFIGSISDIEFGESEEDIFVTMHNYGVVSIWFTNDGGTTWLNKEGDFPDIPVKTILQNPLVLNEVIIGTDLGVWKTKNFNAASPNWTQSHNGMSNVIVLDLDLRDDNMVFAATYGRGVFSGKFEDDPNGDADGDGVLNGVDNCPNTANADQADADGDGIGDVCEDSDGDGVFDPVDNCPNTANADQADADGDGTGDVCEDSDGDGVFDPVDNCPNTANADQADVDGDGIGDVCEDSDGDGVFDNVDNCPTVANADQADADGDGTGDVCEDDDNDGVFNANDNCPNTANADQADGNGDGVGDVCDTSYEAANNIKLETVSETCDGEDDGKVVVTVEQTFVDYKVTVNGTEKDLTGSSVEFTDLTPGDYEVCVSVVDRNYTQCFEITIGEASPIALRMGRQAQSRTYTFDVSAGTAPYNVYLNGEQIKTTNERSFSVEVSQKGKIEVTTAKACEGKFEAMVNGIFLKQNPVTNFAQFELATNEERGVVDVVIYDITGKVVANKRVQKQGNDLSVPVQSLKSGVYILQLDVENAEPIKILKK